jgi:hypothetical protein
MPEQHVATDQAGSLLLIGSQYRHPSIIYHSFNNYEHFLVHFLI